MLEMPRQSTSTKSTYSLKGARTRANAGAGARRYDGVGANLTRCREPTGQKGG